MTREEAIAILEVSKHMATSGRMYNQAIDMAIEALKAEPTDTDLISRADVFEIIDKAFSQPMRDGVTLYADICLMLNALSTCHTGQI